VRRARAPPVRLFIAEIEGRDCGHVAAWGGRDGIGLVEWVYLVPEARRRGIASALVAHAVEDARGHGAELVLIAPLEGSYDVPRRCYAALGFRPWFRTTRYLRACLSTLSTQRESGPLLTPLRGRCGMRRSHPSNEAPMSAPFDLSVTDKLLSTTRAVRKRLDLERPVPRGVLLECIALSQQAPTGSNSQTWRWLIVSDPDKRAELARMYKEGGAGYLDMARQQLGDEATQTKRVYDSAFWLVENLARVPVHVIPCMIGRLPEGAANVAAASMYGSIFPAVWSFQLALRSRGLGSTLTTLHLFQEAEAAKLLGIPDGVSQVGLLPVAYTQGTEFKPAQRDAPETITHFDTWAD